MENNEWSISKEVIFETEHKAFAEGGFRMAYKAKSDDEGFKGNTWVVKKYNASLKETFDGKNLRIAITKSCANKLLGSISLSFFQ